MKKPVVSYLYIVMMLMLSAGMALNAKSVKQILAQQALVSCWLTSPDARAQCLVTTSD